MLQYVIGIVMVAITMAVHVTGATYWLEFVARGLDSPEQRNNPGVLLKVLVSSATVLISLHVVEMLLWALLYVALPENAGMSGLSEAIYFSMVTITTLGYGDITLHADWRVLGGLEAMVGITVFGLTTAILIAVVQNFWKATIKLP